MQRSAVFALPSASSPFPLRPLRALPMSARTHLGRALRHALAVAAAILTDPARRTGATRACARGPFSCSGNLIPGAALSFHSSRPTTAHAPEVPRGSAALPPRGASRSRGNRWDSRAPANTSTQARKSQRDPRTAQPQYRARRNQKIGRPESSFGASSSPLNAGPERNRVVTHLQQTLDPHHTRKGGGGTHSIPSTQPKFGRIRVPSLTQDSGPEAPKFCHPQQARKVRHPEGGKRISGDGEPGNLDSRDARPK